MTQEVEGQIYHYYLQDLGVLLKDYAFAVKAERDQCQDRDAKLFHEGELMAFHRIISLMQQQAASFEIPLENLQLQNIDPERDLM